jgi:hypothetical protein
MVVFGLVKIPTSGNIGQKWGTPALVDWRPEYFSHLLSCIIASCLAQKRS